MWIKFQITKLKIQIKSKLKKLKISNSIFWNLFVICFLMFYFFSPVRAQIDLNQALQEKTQKLQEIHNQLQATQQNLSEVEGQSKNLKQELKKINNDIKQLNLGIQSNQVTIEKLNLEIQNLQKDITTAEKNISTKNKTITQLIKKIQIKDAEPSVIGLLKNKTLSANWAEALGYYAISNEISQDVKDIKIIQYDLNGKLEQRSNKKHSTEVERQDLKIKKDVISEKESERKSLLTLTYQQQQAYQKQISELEKKQLAIADEIEALEKQLRSESDPNNLPTARPGVLAWPAQGRLSQNWGATAFAKYGYKGHWHNGIDIAGPTGTPVTASAKGIVLAIGDQDRYCRRGAYGKYIVIKHENNLTTLYGHLSGFLVSVGDVIKQGDLIGLMGHTGYATGPHLHFTVYDSKTFGMRSSVSCGLMPSGGDLNPLQYL